jgi:alkylated DNA nucleotide flippase Atl1
MRAVAVGLAAILVWSAPSSLGAWGMDVHRFLTGRAVDGLPEDIRPFFVADRAFIVEHSVDPDLWRVAGLQSTFGPEDLNHFLDIDGLDDRAPFSNVPRDRQAFLAKYGAERADKAGRLPWRVEEFYGRLVGSFRDVGRGTPAYAGDNARYLVAVLAHYLEDANQPFHAVVNYDGQLTGQRGIHTRFESDLVLRNLTSLTLGPVAVRPVADVRDLVFERLVEGASLVAPILAADRRATEGRDLYDDGYYAALLSGVRPVLERRLSSASSDVASVVTAAWVEAGRPALPLKRAKAPVRIIRR